MVNCNYCASDTESEVEENQATPSIHNVSNPDAVADNQADDCVDAANMDVNSGVERSDDGVSDDDEVSASLSKRLAATAPDNASIIQNAASPHFPEEPPRRLWHYQSCSSRRTQEARDAQAANNIEEEPSKKAEPEPGDQDWIKTLLHMSTKPLTEAYDDKRHFNFAADATFKPNESRDTTIEIPIPTTIAAALNGKRFSFQWRMAVESELQIKFEEGYEFEHILTDNDSWSCYVIKGMWFFDTLANKATDSIDFKATWLNNDSHTTTIVTYKSTKSGVHHIGTKVTEITTAPKVPESPTKRSKSTCPTCEPIPYSPATYEPPNNNYCSHCAKPLHN